MKVERSQREEHHEEPRVQRALDGRQPSEAAERGRDSKVFLGFDKFSMNSCSSVLV